MSKDFNLSNELGGIILPLVEEVISLGSKRSIEPKQLSLIKS